MARTLTIATRESPLAMWQAEHVRAMLNGAHPDVEVTLLGITSRADRLLDVPLAKVGGKGLFVKELETALLDGRADIAVHSMKDVPVEFAEGLAMGVICAREDPTDAFVSNHYASLDALPAGALVGTSSLRRECQLRERRPDLQVRFLLVRLGLESRIARRMAVRDSLPAGGQGALGIEVRADDAANRALLRVLHHEATARCVAAERAMNRRLQGSCEVPIASYAQYTDDKQLLLRGLVGRPDGSRVLRAESVSPAGEAEELGGQVAEDLLAQGAAAILAEIYGDRR